MQNLNSMLTGLIRNPYVDIDLIVPNEISRMEIVSAVSTQTTQSIQEALLICHMLEIKTQSPLYSIVENTSLMGKGMDLWVALNSPAPFDTIKSRTDVSNNELIDLYSKFCADHSQIQNATNEITEVTPTNTASSSCIQIVIEFQDKLRSVTHDSVITQMMERLRDRADLFNCF